MSPETAQEVGLFARHRANAFLAFSEKRAKATIAYSEWEAACKTLDIVGKEYGEARSNLDVLAQQTKADGASKPS